MLAYSRRALQFLTHVVTNKWRSVQSGTGPIPSLCGLPNPIHRDMCCHLNQDGSRGDRGHTPCQLGRSSPLPCRGSHFPSVARRARSHGCTRQRQQQAVHRRSRPAGKAALH